MLKIVNQTSSKILISSPKATFLEKFFLFIFNFIFGSVFAFGPMLMLLASFSEIGVLKISCDRVEPKQVDCQLSKSKFLDLVQQEPLKYKFVNLAKYDVFTSKDSDGDTVYRYNFSLLTKSGEQLPFTRTSSSTAESVVSALNPFLQSNQESFSYKLDERFESKGFGSYTAMIFVLPFLAVGLNFIVNAFSLLVDVDYEEILLDKSEYLLRHSKRKLFGTKANRFLFMEVAKVDILYATDSYSNVSFIPRITMHSNLQFKLDNITDRQAAINVANDLNRFMGLPEEEDPVVKQ